jgi:hypothetical protein
LGAFSLHAARAEVFLGAPDAGRCGLEVVLTPGAGEVDVYLNGHVLGRVTAEDDSEARARFEVPRAALTDGAQRVAFRTGRAGWIASFDIPDTTLHVKSVAFFARKAP